MNINLTELFDLLLLNGIESTNPIFLRMHKAIAKKIPIFLVRINEEANQLFIYRTINTLEQLQKFESNFRNLI